MLGKLNETQIDNLLLSQAVGRLACCDGKKPYVVPVTYMYAGDYIYGQSLEGMKLNILRKNPQVCFEVDSMTDMANWQSVVVCGNFEELAGGEADEARKQLFDRVLPLMTSATVHPHEHGVSSTIEEGTRIKPVMYRIRIKEKSGRYEKR